MLIKNIRKLILFILLVIVVLFGWIFGAFFLDSLYENQVYTISNLEWPYDIINVVGIRNKNINKVKIAIIDTGIVEDFQIKEEGVIYNLGIQSSVNEHGELICNMITNSLLLDELKKYIEFIYINLNEMNIDNLTEAINIAVKDKVDIINISLGTYISDYKLEEAVSNAINTGIIIVAAAGNDASNQYLFPASYNNVISVTGVDMNGNYLLTNNRNNKICISAPGEKIPVENSYNNERVLVETYGSSAASAIVTEVIAVLKSISPEIDSKDICNIFEKTSIDLGEEGKDDLYGYGLINFRNAVLYSMYPKFYFFMN